MAINEVGYVMGCWLEFIDIDMESITVDCNFNFKSLAVNKLIDFKGE